MASKVKSSNKTKVKSTTDTPIINSSDETDILKNMQNIYKSPETSKMIETVTKMTKTTELEVSINRTQGISMAQYIDLIKHMKETAILDNKLENLLVESTLDITYQYNDKNDDNYSNYRISINNLERVNKLMSNLSIRKNHSIFSILTNNILNQDKSESKNMYMINKVKNKSSIVDYNDFDIRFRTSEELPVSKEKMNELLNLSEVERNKISYRYKYRLSYIINAHEEFNIRIDLTDVKQNMYINKLSESLTKYELELEIVKKTDKPFNQFGEKVYNKLLYEIYKIHQVLQKSNKIINMNQQEQILNKMRLILYGNEKNDNKDLPGMQSESLENQHVASDLTTQYSVTDKADGDRYFLLILSGRIFLVSNNLNVKEIDGSQYLKLSEYDNTILDGEYIYIEENKKYMYLAFDILVYKNVDIRNEAKLELRLDKLNDVLINAFNIKTVSVKYTINDKLPEIVKNIKVIIRNLFDEMNHKLHNDNHVIMGKLFLIPIGLYQSELYAYSQIIWDMYTKDETIKCPYALDGLIYTPLNQKYTRLVKDVQHKIYKWKPSNKNSVDFYVKFQKNPDNGNILNVFDNSTGQNIDDKLDKGEFQKDGAIDEDIGDYVVTNKVYRILNLHVGSNKTGVEVPTLFNEENYLYLAYLYIQDGEIRDIEGNIIQDDTVVEFAYNNNPLIEHPFRWVPLRTRFDKTESVVKYQRKYGNNEVIANKVWRSIIAPFDFIDIKLLADEKTFDKQMGIVKSRVTSDIIALVSRENKYYQIKTNLAKPQRNFHNFIKSNLMYIYGYIKTLANGANKKLSLLENGIGRGGDMNRYYHCRLSKLVGYDVDGATIYDATDGCISRYQKMKRKMPNFPPSSFFVSDGRFKFNLANQEKGISNLSEQNKKMIGDIFGKNENDTKHDKFDIFNFQFTFHFFFESDQVLNNMCHNINKYLNKNGYILITTNDGKLIHDNFVNNSLGAHYTDETGNKQLLFEFKKLYSDTNIKKTGLAIDFFNASFKAEGNYDTEYIVDPEFLIETFETKCGLVLIDTDNFENQFNIHKHFLTNIAPYEANDGTRTFLTGAAAFYNFNDEVNKASFELTKLHRYYVFQKLN